MYNLLAYIKHQKGQNEAALECLRQAEELIQREHTDQAEIRSLVTWGNYAWVYYHMGRLSEAQIYVDKVKQVCEKFSNPYSIECPELDCEEGWTLLKCGGKQNERAKVYFEKALEEKPNNPEFTSGLAIATYCLDEKPQKQFSAEVLKQAIELCPDNQYVKVLFALKLQKVNKEAEAELLVEEALEKAPRQTEVLREAAKFYQKKGDLDKAIELFRKASEFLPNNGYLYHQIGCCYRAKIKQIQNTGESEASENREKIKELKKQAIDYFIKTIEKRPNSLYAYCDLTELLEADERYQIPFSKELPDTERQQHRQQLQNVAENQLPQNAPNYWFCQGLIHKLNGDLLPAAECYEKELGRLLRNSPSGIGRFFLPASELEENSEEMGQGADISILGELPDP
ncbi:hypothetical protein HPG69_019554 [Diceros bicornis minor]|uniref:Interferon-induced protein with tetratricopeptide repeats 3 n=2 Tax=Diceros bicornis minor TaxID=77932 RepID=A0A7J7E622_DICBM|nr:hypothetical protein HPG69_019554 [Diceros bicornis minor]